MTLASDYAEFLATAPEGKIIYETVEIYHPELSQTYYFVNGPVALTADDENGVSRTFEPANMGATRPAVTDDLDQLISFTIGDLDNLLDDEMDRIDVGDETDPIVTLRVYHSDHLDAPAEGPYAFNLEDIAQTPGVFTIQSGAPRLNTSDTGESYYMTDFPMLRGVL